MKDSRPWVVRPSIGNPAIVALKGLETTFEILLAASYGESPESLQEGLKDGVRLVGIDDKDEKGNYVLAIRGHIKELFRAETPEEAAHKFESSGASRFFGWHLISSEAFSPPLKFFLVTLGFKEGDEDDEENIPKIPEGRSLLFSLAVGDHLKPNSICLTRKDWKDFTFIHATDLHVAKRNDGIPKIIGLEGKSGYINFNDHLRRLTSRANEMADRGEADFVFLTGDLIDYVLPDKKIQSNEDLEELRNLSFDEANWLTFYNILTGEDGGVGLRVPAFTLLGNHDYRLNLYNLDDGGDRWEDFGLTEEQFKRYKEKAVEADAKFPQQLWVGLSGLLWYFRYINPDLDYEFSLDSHSFICLDTGPDEFDAGDTDSLGVRIEKDSPSAKSLITKVLNYRTGFGLFLWAFPWILLGLFAGIGFFYNLWVIINLKLSSSFGISLAVFLLTGFIIALERTINIAKEGGRTLLYNLGTLALAVEGIVPGGGPDSAGLSLEQIDWIRGLIKGDRGLLFVCMHTPPVNTSPDEQKLTELNETNQREQTSKPGKKLKYWIDNVSDANLSIGSISRNWAEFLDFLAGIGRGKAVDLVLCGHAHQNIEFRIESYSSTVGSPARLSKKKVGICTDVYSNYINNPGSRPDWWNQNKPNPLTLVLQTTSLGPKGKNVTKQDTKIYFKKGGKGVAGYRIIEVKNNSIIKIEFKEI